MDENATASEQAFLQALRQRRSELRESMSAVEHALAAPAAADPARWAERVEAALVELSADLRQHVELTEGPDGLYVEVLDTAPRLADAMERLTKEHAVLGETIDDLLAKVSSPGVAGEVDGIRELGTDLLITLVRHRQRGADLVYEAYEFDIGGDT